MRGSSNAQPGPAHGVLTTVGVTAAGSVVFAFLLVAGVGVVVAVAAMLLLWVAAFGLARSAGSPLAGPIVAALPLLLVAVVVIWIAILFGGAGG
jgi:hypothetical protein